MQIQTSQNYSIFQTPPKIDHTGLLCSRLMRLRREIQPLRWLRNEAQSSASPVGFEIKTSSIELSNTGYPHKMMKKLHFKFWK